MGKSWVGHGLVTGSVIPRVLPKPWFLASKPRVSLSKSWVVTVKSRFGHEFKIRPDIFLSKVDKSTTFHDHNTYISRQFLRKPGLEAIRVDLVSKDAIRLELLDFLILVGMSRLP